MIGFFHPHSGASLHCLLQESKRLQQNIDHEWIDKYISDHKTRLEQHLKELHRERDAQNEDEARKHEKMMLYNDERLTLELIKNSESWLSLVEKQKIEKEELERRMMEEKRKLNAKQALEMEIEVLKGRVQVLQYYKNLDGEMRLVMEAIQELKVKFKEHASFEDLLRDFRLLRRNSSEVK